MTRTVRLLVAVLAVLAFVGSAQPASAGTPKESKNRLFDRYDQKNVTVMLDNKVLVSALTRFQISAPLYSINYDHFYKLLPKSGWPAKYLKRNLIDEFTTEEVEADAISPNYLSAGEMLRVRKLYFMGEPSKTSIVDIYAEALSGQRFASQPGLGGYTDKMQFGVHLRFWFPAVAVTSEEEYFKMIVDEIGAYLVPTDEYQKQEKDAAAKAEAKKDVTIQPGMTKEEVVKILGEPSKIITFGEKTLLKYPDMTVELQNGKVVDLKTN